MVIFIPLVFLNYFYCEKGTFYELKFSKYYKNKPFNLIHVSRVKLNKNKKNPQIIDDETSERTSKIFNYLNKFNFIEYKKDSMLDNEKYKKYTGISSLIFSSQSYIQIWIEIYDQNHIRLLIHSNELGTKTSRTTKYYKIANGNISSEKL